MEPLIKDTLNKGCTHLYGGNTFLPPKEDSLSIVDKTYLSVLISVEKYLFVKVNGLQFLIEVSSF